MSNIDFDIVGSILTVVSSSGIDSNIQKDLEMPQGKSIAELLNGQKEIPKTDNIEE
jgi:hypothetical protein